MIIRRPLYFEVDYKNNGSLRNRHECEFIGAQLNKAACNAYLESHFNFPIVSYSDFDIPT